MPLPDWDLGTGEPQSDLVERNQMNMVTMDIKYRRTSIVGTKDSVNQWLVDRFVDSPDEKFEFELRLLRLVKVTTQVTDEVIFGE